MVPNRVIPAKETALYWRGDRVVSYHSRTDGCTEGKGREGEGIGYVYCALRCKNGTPVYVIAQLDCADGSTEGKIVVVVA